MEDNPKFINEADIIAIVDLIKNNPNDQELGNKIRKYYNKIRKYYNNIIKR